ncbi:MAG: glycoside hydrolase family 16 protein, partial [Pseudomonadota bacterium]
MKKPKIVLSAVAAGILMAYGAQVSASVTSPVIGALLWSDEFNGTTLNTSVWTTYDGNGCQINLCGYGNQELEYYSPNNLSIVNVPFEGGTRALAIKAQNQTVGSNVFTSGKVDSRGKVQVQYGMVEMRIATPQLGVGLWPAAWMLGTSPQTWPRNGEIDIMEMGHKASVRAQASPPPGPNNFTGSNVITWQQAACVPGNESCAASTAWQTKNWYIPSVSLANRFVIYRMYWTDTQMRFTVVDNGVEHNMYNNPLPVNSTALQAPFYLLLNLAVGGNFTDAAAPGQVTAPRPGTMYVDYVRVYQLDGKGKVTLGNSIVPEVGKFGTFTDLTAVNAKQVAGTSSDIFLWNGASTSAGNTAPFEGSNVIAWNYTTPGQWFGGGIQSRQVHDMSNFRNGTVQFKIKIPANVAFKIGVGIVKALIAPFRL